MPGLATAGVITLPFSSPEFIWAVSGAVLLLVLGQLSPGEVWSGVAKGTNVYLFLIGMMLLSELARQEGLFGWLAAHAASLAKGSAARAVANVVAETRKGMTDAMKQMNRQIWAAWICTATAACAAIGSVVVLWL